jgi:beta-galactosidase
MYRLLLGLSFFIIAVCAFAQNRNKPILLNGTWEFEQTKSAFPPSRFSRKIPVPGLIHLANPKVEEYHKFFKRPEQVNAKMEHSVYEIDYVPRYNWYRKKVIIPADVKGLEVVLTIKKSQYVTQVFVNGIDLGSSIECYTPIDIAITRALKFGAENEILIKVGDRYWLPSQAAGGTDKEKEHYLPGIWDDVIISFTNKIKVNRALLLPSLKESKVTAKLLLWNLNHAQVFYGETMQDSSVVAVKIYENRTRKLVAGQELPFVSIRDRNNELTLNIPIRNVHPWSPEDPFLYVAEISVYYKGSLSDRIEKKFGMRDFERRGKFFYLNGNKYLLRGSNITLQRFFEDPDCSNLAWDTTWVKKMLIEIPKKLDWNAMRICVGIAPGFWYDLADEYGLLFQNEWLYWQNHGWDEQIKKEYTNWVWSDGSHPSIAIWDGINENWDNYIGNDLIPELKQLDPTRIWDAGYMTSTSMHNDDMDEPHPYEGVNFSADANPPKYPLGDLSYKPDIIKQSEEASSAQLVNEYGWIWLWRNGQPSKLTVGMYEHYLGKNSTTEQRFALQAYWLQLETEWLRSNRNFAGVLAFCYLTNNYGYTGDWFIGDVKDLQPSPVLYWFKDCFAPVNVFINLEDERYVKDVKSHIPGEDLHFTLVGLNDLQNEVHGKLNIQLINSKGQAVFNDSLQIALPASDRMTIPYAFKLPEVPGGYLLKTSFHAEGAQGSKMSRRYIKVGQLMEYNFYELPVTDSKTF